MSESDTASVECPLCGEAFDPTAAGGWCTNSDCGEWQYETDVTPDQQTASTQERSSAESEQTDAADSTDGQTDGAESAAEPSVNGESDAEADDTGSRDEPATETDETGEEPETGADAEGSEVEANEPSTETDDAATDTDDSPAEGSGQTTEPESTDDADGEETFDCPGCGSSLAADVNFCPDCGEDVSDLPDEGGDELDACPSCGADVDSDDNFCAQCGEDLDAHRGESDVLDECPDCGEDVDEADSFCASCGADLDAHRSGETDAADESSGATESSAPAPDSLALTAHGKSVVVGDGDTVGREIRSLLTEAGRPEDEAVRVHREHLRFVRESDQFYVVPLGQNPTRLNGRSLAQGDREPVAPGDELELSNVVTLDVEAA